MKNITKVLWINAMLSSFFFQNVESKQYKVKPFCFICWKWFYFKWLTSYSKIIAMNVSEHQKIYRRTNSLWRYVFRDHFSYQILLLNQLVYFLFAGDKELLAYFYGLDHLFIISVFFNRPYNITNTHLIIFYRPVGILLFVNLLLFASTARQLTCGLWKRDEVKSTTER